MSARADYRETECRTALNRVDGMGFRWSLNPYRGCVHGCHYCFARRYHSYLDLSPGSDFTGIIYVKTNVADVLGLELSRRSMRREGVVVGTATDPYQPIEGRYRLTRRCLEALARWRNPASLITKGTLVVRDIDVLSEASRRAECSVIFSITTMDVELARKIEPGTPPPAKRVAAMSRLVGAGIKAGVALAPVVPGITDGAANLEAVVRAAASGGARFLWAGALNLKPGTREHFLEFVEREYPELTTLYDRLYPGAYAPGAVQSEIGRVVGALKLRYGIREARKPPSEPPPQQLRLEPGRR